MFYARKTEVDVYTTQAYLCWWWNSTILQLQSYSSLC